MKILLCSHRFSPDIGGIETISELLGRAFVEQGHEVKVATSTGSACHAKWPFDVVRRPSGVEWLRLARWSDVVFQNNISLRAMWPALLCGRPIVVTHQTWLSAERSPQKWNGAVKRIAIRFAKGVAISKAVQARVDQRAMIIPNPYCNQTFRVRPEVVRSRDLLFVGRLVSDKGGDLLIESVDILRSRNLHPSVTIVGSGPDEEALRRIVEQRRLDTQVRFLGALTGDHLACVMNEHRILVVPSRWDEPFGIVALEGIGCGCVVVGSAGGGLPEAIGPCGVLFKNNDATAFADALEAVLKGPNLLIRLRESAEEHLQQHRAMAVAQRYMQLFQHVMRDCNNIN